MRRFVFSGDEGKAHRFESLREGFPVADLAHFYLASPAPGFLETSQTAYREPTEVLSWMILITQEPRARRPRLSERTRLRVGSGA
jgi:hypothetical protein